MKYMKFGRYYSDTGNEMKRQVSTIDILKLNTRDSEIPGVYDKKSEPRVHLSAGEYNSKLEDGI